MTVEYKVYLTYQELDCLTASEDDLMYSGSESDCLDYLLSLALMDYTAPEGRAIAMVNGSEVVYA